jgi:hypothetical protein
LYGDDFREAGLFCFMTTTPNEIEIALRVRRGDRVRAPKSDGE